jgi:hypothetical protein
VQTKTEIRNPKLEGNPKPEFRANTVVSVAADVRRLYLDPQESQSLFTPAVTRLRAG